MSNTILTDTGGIDLKPFEPVAPTTGQPRRCSKCLAYQPGTEPNPEQGQCRFSPPIVVAWEDRVFHMFPRVMADEWCLEFMPAQRG